MIHGHQVFSEASSEAESGVIKPGKTRSKFSRRRPSSNFVAPVSPLARTPSPTGHNCYFNNAAADPERKTPRTTAQKTLHITHPRTQSLSSITKREATTPAVSSPLSTRKTLSPCLTRRAKNHPVTPGSSSKQATTPNKMPSPGAMTPTTTPLCRETTGLESRATAHLDPLNHPISSEHFVSPVSAVRGEHLKPSNRHRKKSWVQGIEDQQIL